MDETFKLTMYLHTVFIGIVLLLATANYLLINNSLDYDTLRKRVRTILPIYYLFLATVIFTGFVLLSLAKSKIYQSVIFMVIVWFVLLLTTIKRYKKFKSLKRDDKRRIRRFIRFTKRKYLIDITFMLIAIALVYIIK